MKECTIALLWNVNYDRTTTTRTLYVHAVLNSAIFPQSLYDIVLLLDAFYLSSFFPSITFIYYVASYRKM